MDKTRKLNKKRLITVIALGAALLLLVVSCIIVLVLKGGSGGKKLSQPIICEEPVFPATIKAENGSEYVRKLSTYWWVKDVKNGKVIIEDVNNHNDGSSSDDDLGVVDLRGREVIDCDNRDVRFTEKGYIAVNHYENGSGTFYYFNMGGNCLASYGTLTDEAKGQYEGDGSAKEREYVPVAEEIDGTVRYFGKYITVSQYDSYDKKVKMNTCVYELSKNSNS